LVTHPEIALDQACLTLDISAIGLTEKKVYLGGMSILSIILSLEPECHRKATPSSDREASFDVVVHCAQEGIKGGNKRRKQCLPGTMTMACRDNRHNWEAGSSGVRRISATTRGNKRPVRMPMDHIKRLLEEACRNHAYPIRRKLKDCGMMGSFMTSGFLTSGAELDEGLDGSDTTPFSKENTVMTVYGGRSPSGRHLMTSLSPRTPTHCSWGRGGPVV
jgi:hypothetical protein